MISKERVFESIMSEAFSADDVEKMASKLADMRFFTAPASTVHHGAYEGGLFDHSYAVTRALLDLTEKLSLEWQDPRSPYIIGMFHDLCKCDAYVFDGNSIKRNPDMKDKRHAEKSIMIANSLIGLSAEEVACIRWHMGAFDEKENWKKFTAAIGRYPNVLYSHTADMIASQIEGI